MTLARPSLLLRLADAAALGAIFGAVTWLVWDSINTPCECDHCLDTMRTTLHAAELRKHLADLQQEHDHRTTRDCMEYREKYDTDTCNRTMCPRCNRIPELPAGTRLE